MPRNAYGRSIRKRRRKGRKSHKSRSRKIGGSGEKPFAIVQYENRELSEIDKAFIDRNRKYCRQHAYEYILIQEGYKDLPFWWRKVQLVKDMLTTDKYRGCLWLDTDACIYDMNVKLDSIVEEKFHFYMSGDITNTNPNGSLSPGRLFNAGVWLVMNTADGKDIMDKWISKYNKDNWDNDPQKNTWSTSGMWSGSNYEQGSFIEHILPTFTEKIKKLDRDYFNALKVHPGTFIVHFYLGKEHQAGFIKDNPL